MIKSKAYARVTEIGDKYGIDVKDKLMTLAMYDEIPEDIIRFIEKYNKEDGLESFATLDSELKEVLKSKKLYFTLKTSSNPLELAKAISSFLTHILIEYSNNPSEIPNIQKSVDFELIIDSLLYYLNELDTTGVEEASSYIVDLLR